MQWRHVRSLKATGKQGVAEVTGFSTARQKGERGAALEYVDFEFVPSGGVGLRYVKGQRLRSFFVAPPKRGDKLTVIYDLEKPEDFICLQTDDRPLRQRLTAQIFFLAVAALVLLLAGLRYLKLLKIVRTAPAQSGTVVDVRTCAQGAFSRLVVVALQADDRKAIVKRVVPVRLAHTYATGDAVWLLVPPGKPAKAIIADAFL